MKKFTVFCSVSAMLFFAAAAHAVQFNIIDPGYSQEIYAAPLVPLEGGMAWIGSGTGSVLLTRAGSNIYEHNLTPNVFYQGSPTPATPLHGVTLTHSISGLSTTGYGMTNGLDGYVYTVTGSGLERFNPSNWTASAQLLAGTVGGAGYGITTLSDGRIAYSDGAGASSNVYIYDPSSGSNTLIYSTSASSGGQIDGMQGGPGGVIAVTDRNNSPNFRIDIISNTGSLINSFTTAHAPDGLAFGDGAASNALFSNNNDGTISRYTLGIGYSGVPVVMDIAQQTLSNGKAYGDLAAVGPDCAFYVTQAPNSFNGSTPNVGTHWDNGTTTAEASIVRISAISLLPDGTRGEVCGFYSPTETVPEPGTVSLLLAGLGFLVLAFRARTLSLILAGHEVLALRTRRVRSALFSTRRILMVRTFKVSFLFAAISYGLCGAAQAVLPVTFNTFTGPPIAMNQGTVGFAYAGNKFVGSVLLNGPGSLYSTDLVGGTVQAFAPTVSLNSSTGEHFVAASFGLGGFPSGDIYAANGSDIVHITNNGASSNTFNTSPLLGEVRGITFDLFGTFGNKMLVTTALGNVYNVNSAGSVSLLANVGEDVEGLDIAPLGGGFSSFDGQLIVASEASGILRAVSSGGIVTQLGSSGGPLIIPSAEELTFVPLNLGVSGSPLEGLYGANYATNNVQKANGNQFLGMQGDIIVTGETTGDVSRVHWNGSQFVVSQVGSFGAWPANQPEDGIFVTPTMVTPEPSSLALVAAGFISLIALSLRSRVLRVRSGVVG